MDVTLPHLRCPVCGEPLDRRNNAVRCARDHSFDIARQGYVNLTVGRSRHPGDTAEMVADRVAFLDAGHYEFAAAAVAATATAAVAATAAGRHEGLVLDAGTGTGHYLARVLDAAPGVVGLGLDVSKPALRRAARAHPRAGAALADLWQRLPVADAAARLVLNVFAPRNGPEFHRVLRADGLLLVVTPAADHLAELIDAYGLIQVDPDKAGRTAASLERWFVRQRRTELRRTLHLTGAEVATLIGMTPSARHVTPPDGDGHTVTAAVELGVYRKR
ncbi:putative RNA methyltransferase [Mangrovihabitans endophyticus]|uniref:putative RNA methyltransferase n=1 Tax=Mangrovihabitans endophyticus TaxID=1751298 RepID=UPI003570F8F7